MELEINGQMTLNKIVWF